MSVALIVRSVDKTFRAKQVAVEPTFSANYAAGGQVLDFTAMTNPGNMPGGFLGSVPREVRAYNPPAGYKVDVVPGVALNDWKLKFTVINTAVELAAGAYPAPITADDDKMRLEITTKY